MLLADWLTREKVSRKAFADRIGMSPPYVTGICEGAIWPSRDVAARIASETGGEVTANDFIARPGSGEAA